ncbi:MULTISPECIES: DUF4913 domain-containing protein [Streptomyces]|uniref:DUF4913 domain-containing protein n=1 Tax=Streptomyces TaxID=1883 RepID=UPI002252E1B6|nr:MULTISPECIES: DUF4913 domain-containing protein [unclassified Streptomyces]MCX5059040.1 DUF4913 domain-containing protein [Streptomyces sp. NBC_00452]MCZ4515644.1 DUF4913 domain-containing protein [Streptomyces sp. ActVer]
MPESIVPPEGGEPEPVRLPESDLESIEASVRKLLDQSAEQARQLDSLASAPPPTDSPFGAFGMPGFAGLAPQSSLPEPRPILELEGEEYEDELDALSDWVDDFLVRVYGAEVTTAAPWCEQWQEHADVVAWLHALWLAYQQHKDPEAGLSGLFVWHRDFLTHAMATVRAAGGPLSACMTDPDRPAHRLLPGPPPSSRTTAETAESDENGAPGQGAG